MKQVKKLVCAILLLGTAFSFTGAESPYTPAQYKDYQAKLQKGEQYEADDDFIMAMKTYMEAISAYPIIAEEAADRYSALRRFLQEKPGHGQYETEDELIAGYNDLFDKVTRDLCENAQFDIIFSPVLTTEYELDEYTSYWGGNPGFSIAFDLDWFYGAYFSAMDGIWDRGTQSLRYERSGDLHQFGYNDPDSYYRQREVMDFTFDITDKNGTVIVPAEKISQWRPDPEHCTVDPTWSYSYERFYVIKDISGKAKELWLSGSDAFCIRLKSCSVTISDGTVIPIALSRFTTYKGQLPPTVKSLFGTDWFGPQIAEYARQRWDWEQYLLQYPSAPVADLTYLPGRVAGSGEIMTLVEPLYMIPVTEALFTEYTGVPYSEENSEMQQAFLDIFNKLKLTAINYGFHTAVTQGQKFSLYSMKKLAAYYGYEDDQALFAVGIQVKDFNPEYYIAQPELKDVIEELMVAIPGGSVSFTSPESGLHSVSVEDFFIARYPTPALDYQTIIKQSANNIATPKLNCNTFWFQEALRYCNILSARYGYQPCYSINGSTDPATWVKERWSDDFFLGYEWVVDSKDVVCDFTADGFRIPTFDELQYVYYAGSDGSTEGKKHKTEVVTETAGDSFGVHGLHDMANYALCWNYLLQKTNEEDPFAFLLYDASKRCSRILFDQGTWSDSVKGYLWLVRSSPAEAARLAKKAQIPSFPAVTREMIQLYVQEELVPAGKASFSRSIYSKVVCNKKNIAVSSFNMERTEVTQRLYRMVMGENPSKVKGNLLPVTDVSLGDACIFLNRLSTIMGLTPCYSINGTTDVTQWPYNLHCDDRTSYTIVCDYDADGYRLPTQAEWMYACNGLNGKSNGSYDGGKNVQDSAWVQSNSQETIHDVGLLEPNSLGLYDMAGNVWELCFEDNDFIHTYKNGAKNPAVDTMNEYVVSVRRGGSFRTSVEKDHMNMAEEEYGTNHYDLRSDDMGFRFVRKAE